MADGKSPSDGVERRFGKPFQKFSKGFPKAFQAFLARFDKPSSKRLINPSFDTVSIPLVKPLESFTYLSIRYGYGIDTVSVKYECSIHTHCKLYQTYA